MPCLLASRHVIFSCHVRSCQGPHVVLSSLSCQAMPCHLFSCYVVSPCHFTSCRLFLYYGMSCHLIWCCALPLHSCHPNLRRVGRCVLLLTCFRSAFAFVGSPCAFSLNVTHVLAPPLQGVVLVAKILDSGTCTSLCESEPFGDPSFAIVGRMQRTKHCCEHAMGAVRPWALG